MISRSRFAEIVHEAMQQRRLAAQWQSVLVLAVMDQANADSISKPLRMIHAGLVST